MKFAIIVGGWYFPLDFYEKLAKVIIPKKCKVDLFVVCHRNPDEVDLTEMTSRIPIYPRYLYDTQLYSNACRLKDLSALGYDVIHAENKIGDYYFFNQWSELYDYKKYDYCMFLHDDNFLLPSFTSIICDFVDDMLPLYEYTETEGIWKSCDVAIPYKTIDYIANSAVGWRKTARGSFSIWSKKLLTHLKGKFPMDDVELDRTGLNDTPIGKDATENWNLVGRNFQDFIEKHGYMDSSYRLSNLYKTSKYMLECDRGLVDFHGVGVLKNDTINGFYIYG